MKNKNIALIGFMGSGKTSVSKLLAQRLKLERISTDDLIELRENRTISEIFKDDGEPYFRKIERQIVQEISSKKNVIIDCGGGVVLDQRNIMLLRSSGVVIYLKTSAEYIYECIKNQTHRPLLQVEDPLAKIRELLVKREPYYEQADMVINGNKRTIQQICDELVSALGVV